MQNPLFSLIHPVFRATAGLPVYGNRLLYSQAAFTNPLRIACEGWRFDVTAVDVVKELNEDLAPFCREG